MTVACSWCVRSAVAVCASAFSFAIASAAPQVPTLADAEVKDIAAEAYVYAYPLVLMEVTKRVMTNVARPNERAAPVNQFHHMRSIPNASFTDVVRPNADTLYSSMWFDVGKEPLVVSVPDSQARYYLMPILDMWSDVFAAPGKRTTGTRAQTFAIVAPDWKGTLPDGVREIRAPTESGWVIGRTQVRGKVDYPAVHNFQDGIKAVPLSAYGKDYAPPEGAVDANLDTSAPVAQVERMSPENFFKIFTEVSARNAPHANDYPILDRMRRIGLVPGRPFDFEHAPIEVKEALEAAPAAAKQRIDEAIERGSRSVNGWAMPMEPIGTYGTDYAKRAGVARFGLGANTLDDAFYPSTGGNYSKAGLEGAKRYVMHFDKDQLPPARAFWSVTVYDKDQRLADNPLGRFSLGDRDALTFNQDGSLDIYLQRQSPGKAREANWLPTPSEGPFSATMRLYWPKREATDGTWKPPAVNAVP
jgi:hypothetical protein